MYSIEYLIGKGDVKRRRRRCGSRDQAFSGFVSSAVRKNQTGSTPPLARTFPPSKTTPDRVLEVRKCSGSGAASDLVRGVEEQEHALDLEVDAARADGSDATTSHRVPRSQSLAGSSLLSPGRHALHASSVSLVAHAPSRR
jgi:hypothetical protein